ncbi:UNKNOWN [Stylonychia lemnae]|uniref:Uncharacterized protein n=1 Tax=Stylonychia lemnae TaxID=5949 RepID=A0A077ZXM0_STYLE|nr:UNKNOWN [Stylonychia lemnae]|eukprot:CDW73296.1 UNKNOWN [Stylonychia lemnae]
MLKLKTDKKVYFKDWPPFFTVYYSIGLKQINGYGLTDAKESLSSDNADASDSFTASENSKQIKFNGVIVLTNKFGDIISLQVVLGAGQEYPYSIKQSQLHPSPLLKLPSSHYLSLTIPSPHISSHSNSSFMKYPTQVSHDAQLNAYSSKMFPEQHQIQSFEAGPTHFLQDQ